MDTNVLIAALRSRHGASYRLLSLLGSGKFEINLSVALLLEYEDAAKRLLGRMPMSNRDLNNILDYLCKIANHISIYYLWQPFLQDPKDDMVLELAVAGGCDSIVTFNRRDFRGSDAFGLKVLTPKEFLQELGVLP
jgi:putative PIN family toxin of toxin-antitoxin system